MRADWIVLVVAAGLGIWLGRKWIQPQPQPSPWGGPLLAFGYYNSHPVATTPGGTATWGLGVPNIGG